MDDKQPIVEENDSLEAPSTVIEQTTANPNGPENQAVTPAASVEVEKPDQGTSTPSKAPTRLRLLLIIKHLNIYLLFLFIIVAILIFLIIFAIRNNRDSQPQVSTATDTLSNESLQEISGSDIKVGDPKQTLSIESNTIFAGKILARDNVDIAGSLTVGGKLSLAGIDITGDSLLDNVQLESLNVTGGATIQGAVSMQNNLNVSGTASFGGNVTAPQITVNTLELNRDLKINRHIVTSGGSPSRTNGASIGAGGTSSVNGTDTAGTVTINTGSNSTAGCLVNINFAQAYANTPRVVITPASSNAGALDFYTSRSSTGFSICSASDPPDGSAGMTFDYIIIG